MSLIISPDALSGGQAAQESWSSLSAADLVVSTDRKTHLASLPSS